MKQGETSFLDPRWKNVSYGEGKLVELIEKCWEFDPKLRPTSGEIVLFLRDALKKHLEWEREQQRKEKI